MCHSRHQLEDQSIQYYVDNGKNFGKLVNGTFRWERNFTVSTQFAQGDLQLQPTTHRQRS